MCFYGYRYIQASQLECANAFTYGHDLGLVGTLLEVQYGVSYRYMLTVPICSVSTCFYDYRYIQASGLPTSLQASILSECIVVDISEHSPHILLFKCVLTSPESCLYVHMLA
jgi:hypothetical protein